MDAPLLSLLSPASLVSIAPVDTPVADAQNPMRGADFANLLGHLMDPAGRQDLAAAGLQSVPIGPQIQVITVAEPLPDADSLLAFARGQGLDDATLKALFGPAPSGSATLTEVSVESEPSLTQGSSVLASSLAATRTAEAPLLTSALALDPSRPVYLVPQAVPAPVADMVQTDSPQLASAEPTSLRPAWSLPMQAPIEPALEGGAAAAFVSVAAEGDRSDRPFIPADIRLAPAPLAARVAVELPALPALPVTVAMQASAISAVLPDPVSAAASSQISSAAAQPTHAASLTGAGQTSAGSVAAGAPPLAVSLAAPGLVAASGSVSDLRWQLSGQSPSAPADGPEAVQAQDSTPDRVLLDVLRLRLAPQEAITRRLAAMSGSGEQTAWASVLGQAPSTALLRLDLRDPGLKLPAALDPALASGEPAVTEAEGLAPSTPTHASPEAGRSNQASAASVPTAWASTAAQRAEQYEELAQRLGQALGQRLQSQLERGQWKMQMRLDPAHLGRIDLELDMSAGGLDAVFRSDNPITRDLIAQGLPRLKESLNQSGTAVANVWVQGDSSRQSGGNPTPWRAPETSGQAAGHEADSQEPIVPATVNRARQGTSAWDVLA
jgi:flagellar hook-length control protein FliK